MTSFTEIKKICTLMHQKDYVLGASGNVSCRDLSGKHMKITTEGAHLGLLEETDLVCMDFEGEIVKGWEGRTPSKEWYLHAAIYRARKNVNAIILAQPPLVVSMCDDDTWKNYIDIPWAIEYLDSIVMVEYNAPGSDAMGKEMEGQVTLTLASSFILKKYGTLTVGESLMGAFVRLEGIIEMAKLAEI